MRKIISLLFFVAFAFCGQGQNGYSLLHTFNGTTGGNPRGSLILEGNYMYGMTAYDGTGDSGVVFKMKPDGTNYTKLLDFNGINGATPYGDLISDGTYLYGMTQYGNFYPYHKGIIFKIKPNGTDYTIIYSFNGTNGSYPHGSLVSDGTYLYGMTNIGGTNGQGVIFKIKTDGTGYTVLFNFNGTNGAYPYGSLISDGTYLYGVTNGGGTNGYGVIFKMKTDGTFYTVLLNFNGTNGGYPCGALLNDGIYLYGMTQYGGTNQKGVIFKIKPDGTSYIKLLDFNGTNGQNPRASLINGGTYLYGTTQYGGTNQKGVIFRIKPNGTDYTVLHSFDGTNGSEPCGSLISDGAYLYGMAANGGANNKGVVFKSSMMPCRDTVINNPQSICAGSFYYLNNHTYTLAGIYNDTLQTVYGCDSIIVTQLTVNAPNININSSSTACVNGITTLGASGANTYTWSTLETGASISVTLAVTTIYAVYGTDEYGCTSSSEIMISVLPCTSVDEIKIKNEELKIYPNPVEEVLNVEFENTNSEIKIFDVLAKEVMNTKNTKHIDVSTLPKGIYFIKVGNEVRKFVKE